MSWFVLTELPFEGTVVQRFGDEVKARARYEEDKARVGDGKDYLGVALIEGRIVENERFNLDVWD